MLLPSKETLKRSKELAAKALSKYKWESGTRQILSTIKEKGYCVTTYNNAGYGKTIEIKKGIAICMVLLGKKKGEYAPKLWR
jgi:hypothetical protein